MALATLKLGCIHHSDGQRVKGSVRADIFTVIYMGVVSLNYSIVPISLLSAFQDSFIFLFIPGGYFFAILVVLILRFPILGFTNINHTMNMKKICVSE